MNGKIADLSGLEVALQNHPVPGLRKADRMAQLND